MPSPFNSELNLFITTEKSSPFILYIEREDLTAKMVKMSLTKELEELKTGDIQFDLKYFITVPTSPERRNSALNYVKKEQTRKFINDFFKNAVNYKFEIIHSGVSVWKVADSTNMLKNDLNKENFIEILNNLISIIPVEEYD